MGEKIGQVEISSPLPTPSNQFHNAARIGTPVVVKP
jgi:hypothetical protein